MSEKTLEQMSVEELKKGLEYWENEHFRMQCADDFYYSNGGWESTERTINAYKKELEKRSKEV